MNAYIIVEGDTTETKVYPEWLRILAPSLKRIRYIDDFSQNNYYLFSGHGIPSIYNHICNAIEDINNFNAAKGFVIDVLMICMDTEEETRDDILDTLSEYLQNRHISLNPPCRLVVFEHNVAMETWFLGNTILLRPNVQEPTLLKFRNFYNVRENDPELMDNIAPDLFSTKAQFHCAYLKEIFKENHMKYSKSNPKEVCKQAYLERLIERYRKTGHIASFGRWYDFVTRNF